MTRVSGLLAGARRPDDLERRRGATRRAEEAVEGGEVSAGGPLKPMLVPEGSEPCGTVRV